MASTATRIGVNGGLYRNTGSYGSPVWVLIDNVRDLTMGLEADEADASIRGAGGMYLAEPTLIKASLEWNMNEDTLDTNWTYLQGAFFARTAFETMALDRPTASGAQGLRSTVKLFKFSQGQPIDGLQTTDVTAKPCAYGAFATPAWYTV